MLAEQLASLPGSPNQEEVRNTPGDRCDGDLQSGRQVQQREKRDQRKEEGKGRRGVWRIGLEGEGCELERNYRSTTLDHFYFRPKWKVNFQRAPRGGFKFRPSGQVQYFISIMDLPIWPCPSPTVYDRQCVLAGALGTAGIVRELQLRMHKVGHGLFFNPPACHSRRRLDEGSRGPRI